MTTMLPQLTDKQKETLEVIEAYLSQHSVPPTLSELQVLLGVTSNQAVLNHLDGLEEKGYIERRKTARGIRILKGLQEEEDTDFLELLANLSAKKKNKPRKEDHSLKYAEPVSQNENDGEIILGGYNNEQY